MIKYTKKLFLFILVLMFSAGNAALAVESEITTYLPEPEAEYQQIEITDNFFFPGYRTLLSGPYAAMGGDFSAGMGIETPYLDNAYTPGLFWASENVDPTNNSSRPKVGIWAYTGSRVGAPSGPGLNPFDPLRWGGDDAGYHMQFGTSNNYSQGITNTAMVFSPKGYLGVGIPKDAPYEPKSRLWIDRGYLTVQNGPKWSKHLWPISFSGLEWNDTKSNTHGAVYSNFCFIGGHELNASGTGMNTAPVEAVDGFLAFGLRGSTNSLLPTFPVNDAGFYFIKAAREIGIGGIPVPANYPVFFHGLAEHGSLYLSEEGNVYVGWSTPTTAPSPPLDSPITPSQLGVSKNVFNLSVNDIYLRSIAKWASSLTGSNNQPTTVAATIKYGSTVGTTEAILPITELILNSGIPVNAQGEPLPLGTFRLSIHGYVDNAPAGSVLDIYIKKNGGGAISPFGRASATGANQRISVDLSGLVKVVGASELPISICAVYKRQGGGTGSVTATATFIQ